MEHFLASQVEITHVLSLYPSFVLPKLPSESEKKGDLVESDDMDSSPTGLLDSDDSPVLEPKKLNNSNLMALIKFLLKKRPNIVGKAAAESTEEVVSDAVGQTFVNNESSRSKKSAKVTSNFRVYVCTQMHIVEIERCIRF